MQIKQVTTKKEWEDFLSTQDPSIYVQSWGYGEFNKKMGDDFVVIGIYKDEKIVGGAMFLEINARRGKFLYAPYSPILDYKDSDLMKQFFVQAKEIAKSRKIDFIRISPFEDDKDIHIKNLRKLGFKKAPMHMIAETTWILPLNDNEEDLLRNMKQNHRNLVRRADRDGVKVLTSKDTKDVAKIHELLVTTSKRHKFIPFSLKYLETEFETFLESDSARIFLAYHEEDLLAAAIVFYYGDTAVYKHGASNMLKPKIPASYAIQWAAIKEAKKRGLKYYNFWGIAPEGEKKHPFYGITHFKKGFNGFQKDLIPAQD
ncbi:MAG: peptidoglycan bridge formation glycyltransferase FemA/FemB family protein, partial [Rhodospirillaceae bacterium]|nr:peptidoglycan bridge formation glycyltransferase FemA/FemB family protein [Rhodospirillaceae bacterium]